MASAFSHAIVAVACGRIYTAKEMPRRFWLLSIACSILPDIDVISFAFGISYGDVLGHRGLTHSLFFALLLGGLVVSVAFKHVAPLTKGWWSLVFYFFVVTASHAFLDALTNGGLGVALFSPFETTRYFFPWRPVEVSPIGIASFFSSRGMAVIISEIIWIWIPSTLILMAVWLYRKLRVTDDLN